MKKLFYLLLLGSLISLSSCNLRKNTVYFQTESSQTSKTSYTPVFKKDDLLSIKILSDNPIATEPFNIPIADERTTNSGYTQGNPERAGYLIDEDGYINLPILGQVKIAGLKRTEAVQMIEEKLKPYLSHPVVNIQILNYKITVLGDVKSPGTFKIPNERITVLEALGLAGDIKITGKRKNVLVIRDTGGEKKQYRFDLTQGNDIFNSPVYYLEQNDVVYVEPNLASRTSGAFWRTSATVFISTAGVIISTISVLSK